MKQVLLAIYVQKLNIHIAADFLNQVRTGLWLARSWFLIIASLHECLYACVHQCVCVCLSVCPRGY